LTNTPEQERILARIESVQMHWMAHHLAVDYEDDATKPLIEAIMYVAVLIEEK